MKKNKIISKYFSELAKKGHRKLTKKQKSEKGRKMALARWSNSNEQMQSMQKKAPSAILENLRRVQAKKIKETK